MIANFISIPVLMVLSVLQSTAISRIILINGSADIVMLAIAVWGVREKGYHTFVWALVGGLMTALMTAMPFYIPLLTYFFVAIIAKLLFGRIWQSPILMLILIVFVGTLFQHLISILYLQFSGTNAGFLSSLQKFTLPSILLNLFFIFPVYVLMSDIHQWARPGESYE